MTTDLDIPVDRRGSDSVKWDLYPKFIGDAKTPVANTQDLLPMWIADMDFRVPRAVIDALKARIDHGVFGYTGKSDTYDKAVVDWMASRHGWQIQPDMICPGIGVVPVLHLIVREFTRPGDKIIIQPPVYPPFFDVVNANKRRLVLNDLVYADGAYAMDFDRLEQQARDPETKMAILCSPHNPVGRVWRRKELIRFGNICLDNDVRVVADEIHGDLILKGHRLLPFASISDTFADRSLTCTAPSKTFNIASLMIANTIISNPADRNRFNRISHDSGIFGVNAMGAVACEAAYRHGGRWLENVLDTIEGNFAFVYDYLGNRVPQIRPVHAEGTYLAWLDCRNLPVDTKDLDRFMREKAGLLLNPGASFGPGGEGFVRMNLACPRVTVEEAMQRIEKAFG